jgi:hypothetical protein
MKKREREDELFSSVLPNFVKNVWKRLQALVFVSHSVVEGVVEHGSEFLLRHVRVSVQHLESE